MKTPRPYLVGLLQALGVALYCALVATFFWFMNKYFSNFEDPPQMFVMTLILILLVFSAAVTGSIVFGYPAYLTINKKFKEGLAVLGYTLLFAAIIIALFIGGFVAYR